MLGIEYWSAKDALHPLLCFLTALAWGILILSYPPCNHKICIPLLRRKLIINNPLRKLDIALLALPLYHSFVHHDKLTPWLNINDTFARFLYIWWFHMSNVTTILEYTPKHTREKPLTLRSRLTQAYEVLFSIRLETRAQRHANCGHSYTYRQFCLRQASKALIYWALQEAYDRYNYPVRDAVDTYLSSSRYSAVYATANASWDLPMRIDAFLDWNVFALWMYEMFYSGFALLCVGVLRLDDPADWRMSLCGPFAEAWSVRRYWGKHWHSYIYLSFTAHTKVVTRGWMGLQRGAWTTRVVENSAVFLMSGLAHSAVRWAQMPEGDCWAITLWYVAQMVPILVEQGVQTMWWWVRERMGIRTEDRCANAVARAAGYAWMAAWFMWSIPWYSHYRKEWTMAKMMPIWKAEYLEYAAKQNAKEEEWAWQHGLANVSMASTKPRDSLFGLMEDPMMANSIGGL